MFCCSSTVSRKNIFKIALGIVIGYLFAKLHSSNFSNEQFLKNFDSDKFEFLRQLNFYQDNTLDEDFNPEIDFESHNWNERLHLHRNTTLKQKLNDEVRVLCWIMTCPQYLWFRARHIEKTWGKRCNKLLIMSSQPDDRLANVIALPVGESRDNLWGKTREAFKYIHKHHLDEYDWFYKADDDTYAIMENMRFMLYPYSPSYPVHFGCRFRQILKEGYMSGGAGYVLSREAVKRLVEDAMPDETKCRPDAAGAEDAELAKCLANVNVTTGDSRDSDGLGRFFPFSPDNHLVISQPVSDYWYWHNIYYKTKEGVNAASDFAISFHYIDPRLMYVLEYFIYHLHPFGIVTEFDGLPKKLTLDEMHERFEESEKDKVEGEFFVPEVDSNDIV